MRDYRWHLKHWSKNAWITTGSPLEVDVAPASPEDMSAFEATLPAADEADVDGLARDLEKLRVGKLRPHERAELRALTPAKRAEMRAMAASTSRFGSFLLKAVLIFFAVMIAAPILIIGLGWAVTALGK